ncbi:MAG: hypothetical protein KJ725_00030 [Gammaproteobacteria bacterium]|nr:hypothetical protein [Gammaproteobacteria bacterium]
MCQQGQMIHFKQIESVGDHLLIDYPGDNEWVTSQIDMLMHYARRVDETTGDAKSVER